MTTDEAITYPLIGRGFPEPGSVGVMVASQNDLRLLCRRFHITEGEAYPLYMSRLYVVAEGQGRFSMVGPLVGAPYGAMILETLIAAGIRNIIFWGWCGAVSAKVKIGDIIVPNGAVIDEGTSVHYGADTAQAAQPSAEITTQIKGALTRHHLEFHEGLVWSTDAIFRETPEKVERYRSQGALAVEMETSALFSIGRYRAVKMGAILMVSDELDTFVWNPGFKDQRFKQNRRRASNVIGALCQSL